MAAFFEFLAELFGSVFDKAGLSADHAVLKRAPSDIPVRLYNTASKSVEIFIPQEDKRVKMYNCGPTVYGPQHIGNLSMFVFTDILRRMLEWNGYEVKQVINFTDVGHLTSDADEGEDKMTKGLKREGFPPTLENMRILAEKYAEAFKEDLKALNVNVDSVHFPFASHYIGTQISIIEVLEKKGFAYKTSKGIYFDTSKFPNYGRLGDIHLVGLKEGARIGKDVEKRNPTDFNLWKFDSILGWESPWGKGFPGWHIECSAMIHELLGETIDIHTGGIEHIPVHHNNEIAQSESAFGVPLARFWLHRAHVQMGGMKIAKSDGNVLYLQDIVKKGYDPLALRYLFLMAHYRSPSNFTWEALEAAQNSLHRLREIYAELQSEPAGNAGTYLERFHERINDDLDTPGALAVLWDMTRNSRIDAEEKRRAIASMDSVLGLSILQEGVDVPPDVQRLLDERETARKSGAWEKADELRKKIAAQGFTIKDTSAGPRLFKQK